jgi:hypothetical protein
MTDDSTLDLFVELSSALTGYDLESSPWALDVAETYLAYAEQKASQEAVAQVLETYAACVHEAGDDARALEGLIGQRLMTGFTEVSNLARSILWLWYLSAWYDRPEIGPWPDIYPERQGDIVPGIAYTRGLAFQAGQSHPPGYTETRYGSWGGPPPPDPGPFYPPAGTGKGAPVRELEGRLDAVD